MAPNPTRREALQQLGLAATAVCLNPRIIRGQSADFVVAGQPVEIEVGELSAATVRITIRPLAGAQSKVADTGALVRDPFGPSKAAGRSVQSLSIVKAGGMTIRITDGPLTLAVADASGTPLQQLILDAAAPGLSFQLPKGPLLGLGEGGPQFDRKGYADPMRNGQGGFRLATNGTRAPIQWLIGTMDGWAMFIHQPYGAFDFTGTTGRFTPPAAAPLPIDLFIVASRDPRAVMREYARITGLPEMPARWTLGYLQSHRTLAGREEVMSVARIFRERKLPCDALIYLGTEFTPSGWNTRNGEFTWHPTNFPDPQQMIDTLHAEHFRVIFHVVIEGRTLTGRVGDPCTAAPLPSGRTPDDRWPPDRQVSCYWPAHKPLADMGVDGWWPDQGDGFDGPSRLNRHRMYWEGMQAWRPNERPFALHRNASAGIQRFGGFIWSGDVQSRWDTLKTHVPVAINTGLSGLPLWGTDIGGFYPSDDYTGELHVRWFQFGAFCPLFRAHGRPWHLKLPWGWDGGDGGPTGPGGDTNWKADPAELQNKNVEPICRKYLELRYRLLPYIYTALRETAETGLPMMRALWLHAPDDARAVACGDQFLFGPDLLVAPVVEKGATSRQVYLPRGRWVDFWTEQIVEGGTEVARPIDLATTPLYVRAGAVVPMGPIKQYADEPSDAPPSLVVYPGADGSSSLYDDDGKSFEYRKGAWRRLDMKWQERTRTLTVTAQDGPALKWLANQRIEVRIAGGSAARTVTLVRGTAVVKL
jgi:alpha-glucosidase/alpha-D-xyloside xylohydrolase